MTITKLLRAIVSWAIAGWACWVFLNSLPYKFTGHPDTVHIFSTIGESMGGLLGDAIGAGFTHYGAYIVGTFELVTSVVLLLPALLWASAKATSTNTEGVRARFHRAGGLMAAAVMAGAVFFHLFTSLGIKVLHQGESDGGSLFYAAVSILVGGLVLYLINAKDRTAHT